MTARAGRARDPWVLSPADVAELLDVPIEAVERLVADGRLRAVRIGRYLRIARADVEALLDAAATPRVPAIEPGAALALYRACVAVTEDDAVAAWLWARGIAPEAVRILDLARVLPAGETPSWAGVSGRRWVETGHRLVLPLWDEDGELQSLRALRIGSSAGVTPEKSGASAKRLPAAIAPGGSEGLLLADMLALALLRPRCMPPEDHDHAVAAARTTGVRLAAAEISFLREAAHLAQERALVFGLLRESWVSPLTARLPRDCRVTLIGPWGRRRVGRIAALLGERLLSTVPRA